MHLKETYGGSADNMNTNAAYYCYTIYDRLHGMYYSGSRGVEGTAEHDLLSRYFTSSKVVDFKNRMMKDPSAFDIYVEYFKTRADAFEAEVKFHKKHKVGHSKEFYNVAAAGGSNCGAGSVLCKKDDGTIYRVSKAEFKSGKHRHISKGRMCVRLMDGTTVSIPKEEFNPQIHRTQFADHVLCYDSLLGKKRRIPKEEFDADPNRYVGHTTGKGVFKDIETGKNVMIPCEEAARSPRYVGCTAGSKNPGLNKNRVVVYDTECRRYTQISVDERRANPTRYANTMTTHFIKLDGILFFERRAADRYYRQTRGRALPRVLIKDLASVDPNIIVISREDHMRGIE